MDLERLAAALGVTEVVGRAPVEIRDLAYDARTVTPGAVFFCVPGGQADGHAFAAEAVERGAVALVVERPLELDAPQVVVPDARAAMAVAADEFFERPTEELQVVGVTGTSGKTTTTFLVRAGLRAAGLSSGLIGTVSTMIGDEAVSTGFTTP
ncbi:MAG TPA: Mur ligase domain-containing protein, partial [Gaiellaceae bacterium]